MIVITAPTSQIGSKLVTQLLDAGAPLRLISRSPAKLPPTVRDRVDVIEGSHGDGATAGTRAIYRKELATRGFPEDSVAGATALFLSVGWELANGRPLSAAQNRAIFQQAASGLRSTPLARQSDARRQQESEMRMIISALWLQEARLRARSSGSMKQLSDAVWRDLKAITKNDMRAYRVSEKGFVDL